MANPESWNYRYNYITCIKSYWVQKAVKDGFAKGTVAWIDFGFDELLLVESDDDVPEYPNVSTEDIPPYSFAQSFSLPLSNKK